MENMPKLKVGVIGTGALGRHHARLYAQSPNAEMVGIFDVQQDAAQRVGAEFNLKVFDTWQELAGNCDALSVAVPANYHAQTTIPLLEMGKHILVEKPVAAKLEEAEFLSELDYGKDDGKPEDDVVLRLGIVENPDAITPDTDLDDLRAAGKAALKKWDSEAILPKAWYFLAERAGELEKQWQNFAAMVLEKYHGKTVVAVTSNGIARFSKAILPEGVNLDGSLKLATGAFGIYEYDGRIWKSTQWNLRPQVK